MLPIYCKRPEIIQWGLQCLLSLGYTLKSTQPEEVKDTPWSYIIRFAIADGYIYLKTTPPLLALEANIIQTLAHRFHISVPKIIAHNARLNCFLMKDAGKSLREILKQRFNADLFCKAIDQFTSMQLAVCDHVDLFIELGVPDLRLDKLPDLYLQLLSQKEVLLEDGLSEKDIRELKKRLPIVSHLCQTLAGFRIKPSIVQPDFNDNNTIIDEISQTVTMIDLGEIVISHPFFSLINGLEQVKKHHALTEEDETYKKLMEACLKNFLVYESKKNLLTAFKIARPLLFIYGALCDYRLMIACDKAKFTSSFQRHGRPSLSLKAFMALSST